MLDPQLLAPFGNDNALRLPLPVISSKADKHKISLS